MAENQELEVAPERPAPTRKPEAALTGVVIGLDALPDAQATVWAYSKATPRDSGTTTTGANGSFRIAGLGHPAYDVVAVLGDATALALAVPAAEEVKLQLVQRAGLQVRVLDAAGKLVPDAETTLARPEENNPDGLADALLAQLNAPPVAALPGEFLYALGARGTYQVFASSPTQGSGSSALLVVTESTIRISVDIKVLVGQSISGRVVDSVARPIDGATVRVVAVSEDGARAAHTPEISSTSDAQGNFLIEPVPPGTYSLNAWASGYADVTIPDLVVHSKAPTQGIQVTLVTGGSIAGTVTSNGTPVANATVSAWSAVANQGTSTDEDGNFTLDNLPSETYQVEASITSLDNLSGIAISSRMKVVEVNDGETVELNIETNEGEVVSGTIHGLVPGNVTIVRLRDPGADPAPAVLMNATLNSEVLAGIVAQAQVGTDGKFAMQGIPAGDYALDVYSFSLALAATDGPTFGPEADSPKATVEVSVGEAPVAVEVSLP